MKDCALLSDLAAEIGHFLQCLFFFLNLPQHFDFNFFEEHPLSHPVHADLRASSIIEILEAMMFDFSTPQNGQTIQVSWRILPHSEQSSMPRIDFSVLGRPK